MVMAVARIPTAVPVRDYMRDPVVDKLLIDFDVGIFCENVSCFQKYYCKTYVS